MSITINPFSTNQPQDSFLLQTQGLIQGMMYDDPTARLELAGGVLNSGETVPMWGGRAISEFVNYAGSNSDGLGPQIYSGTAAGNSQSATAQTITGFSVYNQANSMVITPGQTAPQAGVGNYVAFVRNGSNARIAVKIAPALVTALIATPGPIAQPLYWDTTNYQITTSGGTTPIQLAVTTRLLSINTNSKLVSYNSGTGAVTWTTGTLCMIQI
jgi:hypothetical protein